MKQIYLLLLLPLALTLACNKTFEYEYAVVCDFPEFFADKNKLLVTADDGTLLKEFDVLSGQASVSEKFTLNQKAPYESFNLHTVQTYGMGTNIYSCYGVRNGEAAYMYRRMELPSFRALLSTPKTVKIKINSSPSSMVYSFPGCGYNMAGDAAEFLYEVYLANGEGIVAKLHLPGSYDSRWLYLPAEMVTDSIVLDYGAFLAPNKFLRLTPPLVYTYKNGVFPYYSVRAYATSPDEKYFVMLGEIFNPLPSDIRKFWVPENLLPSWNLKVLLYDEPYCFEKTFPLSELIQASDPMLSIDSKSSVPGKSLRVKYSGPADWMDATSIFNTGQQDLGHVYWHVMGHPRNFENLEFPQAVQDLLPEYARSEIFKGNNYIVRAFHATGYTDEDMMRGFPWKATEPFAASQKGYEMVQK